MTERMSADTAEELVRVLLGAACALDHAVAGAVRDGVGAHTLRTFKRTAGEVMGLTYCYLGPCFKSAPELDPGSGGKPLGSGPVPAVSGSAESFLQLLSAVDDAIQATSPRYEAAVSAEERAWIRQMRDDVLKATLSGRTAIARLAG